jgi:hypothetical protein
MPDEIDDFNISEWLDNTKATTERECNEIADKIRSWNPETQNVYELANLIRELNQSIKELHWLEIEKTIGDYVDLKGLSIAEAYKDRVDKLRAYPIWTCDKYGLCLCGVTEGEADIQYIEKIEK